MESKIKPVTGEEMMAWAEYLFPICRSLTGDGIRQTLSYFNSLVDNRLNIHEIPTGTKVFDWDVPDEWNIRQAWIKNSKGETIVDFKQNNLHLLSYSVPVDKKLSLSELQSHLWSLPEQPNAIPYVTSYYSKKWGFCLSDNQRNALPEDTYHVFIDSDLQPGNLTYADMVIPGDSEEEILISSYACHPSMANNELSGPILAIALARWLMLQPKRRYTYRFYIGPETIGAICYLDKHLKHLKRHLKAGFVLSCIGDDGPFSMVSSKYENTYADKLAHIELSAYKEQFLKYSFLYRGSDERQYGSANVDLPVVTLCRSKFGCYDEYHTSLDNLDFISAQSMHDSFDALTNIIELAEADLVYKVTCKGEPQLGKRGLYPNTSMKGSAVTVRDMMNFIAYADGTNSIVDICNLIQVPYSAIKTSVENLLQAGLIEKCQSN